MAILDDISLYVVLPLVFIGMFAACLFGQFLNARTGHNRKESADDRGLDGFVVSGIFGLMALLMAFSFSLAIGRFEERRADVVEEANAISTMYSRLALLPDAQRRPLEADIRQYARLRVAWGSAHRWQAMERFAARADTVSDRFAARLFAIVREGPADPRMVTLINAYNAMSDIAATRHALRQAHLPGGVIVLLAIFLFGASVVLGFTTNDRKAHSQVGSAMLLALLALLALAFCAILDLDRPTRGTFLVPQDEMIRLAAKLNG